MDDHDGSKEIAESYSLEDSHDSNIQECVDYRRETEVTPSIRSERYSERVEVKEYSEKKKYQGPFDDLFIDL
jgi:hypothetical protein